MSGIYTPLNEYTNELDKLYETGIVRGAYCGFETLHPFYSIRPASTTYIFGAPFSGKTEFWFDILVFLSEEYKWKHALYTPESGNKAEIMAELISKYCRKHFYKQQGNYITETEYYNARAWVGEYFFPIDPSESDLSIDDFFNEVTRIENSLGITINTTCCDPFNELKHSTAELDIDNKRQDLYIENRLGFIRRNAAKSGRHNAIITHCTEQALMKGQAVDGGDLWYYPPPQARQVAGGQAWYRKAMNLLSVWRPPVNLFARDGSTYQENEVHVTIHKYKPKGVGKRGVVKLYYDPEKNRYYEIISDQKRYADSQLLRENQERINFEATNDKPLF